MKQALGDVVRKMTTGFDRWRRYTNSRKYALSVRDKVVRELGRSVVDKNREIQLQEYALDRFGDHSYWPWLALYTELRGEFVEGWIPDDYYSFELIPEINPEVNSRLSMIKSFDHQLFPGFAISPVALVSYGNFFDGEQHILKREEFLKLMHSYGDEVVVKRDGAASGAGIFFTTGAEITLEIFSNSHSYVIQPVVRQAKVFESLYPDSVNSLRLTTYLGEDGLQSVKHRSFRFGSGSGRISNTSGLFLHLNDEGRSLFPTAFNDIGLPSGEKHPDTGYDYNQLQVSAISEAEEACLKSHLKYPYVRLIAWDIYFNEQETPKLMEWNAVRPDMWVNEALVGPLW